MTDPNDARVDAALAAFAVALDGPNPPTAEAFLAAYPDLAGELAPLFRAVAAAHTLPRAGSALVRPAGGGTVGPYRLVREIGRGGMGVVYEAEDTQVPRRVAVKVVRAGALGPEGRSALLREARIAAALQHPHVVPVLAAGEVDGGAYIAMQYVDGRPLSAVVRARRLDAGLDSTASGTPSDSSLLAAGLGAGFRPPAVAPTAGPVLADDAYAREVAALGLQAALALAFVHDSGVLHRDIKPGNLLLDVHGHLWLADFGLARLAHRPDDTLGGRVGTLRYASPEQVAGGHLDPRADVYALGATLYELLTLHPPFHGNDPRLLARIQDEDPVPVRRLAPGVPVDLATVVHKAMAKRPADRYPSAAELGADLGRFLAGEPVRARLLSRRRRAARWAARQWRGLAAAGAALLLGLALAAVFAWRAYRAEADARHQFEQREVILRELLAELNKSESVFRHLPQGQAEHLRLLRALKDTVCRWADEPEATDASRAEAVRACVRLAAAELNAQHTSEAARELDEALERVTALRAADPGRAQLRFLHATVLQYRARAVPPDQAVEAAAAAADLFEGLVAESPDRDEYRNPLDHVYATLATRARLAGRADDAVRWRRKGLVSNRHLAVKYPDGHPQSYIRLCGCLLELAADHAHAGDLGAAAEAAREAVRHDDTLREPRFAFPGTNREWTFQARTELAGLLLARGDAAGAEEQLRAAAPDVAAYRATYGDRPYVQAHQWRPAYLLGQAHFLAGREADARAAFRSAAEAAEGQPSPVAWAAREARFAQPFAELVDSQPVADGLDPLNGLRRAVLVGDHKAAAAVLAGPRPPLLALDGAEFRLLEVLAAARAGDRVRAADLLAAVDRDGIERFARDGRLRVLRRQVNAALAPRH